MIAVDPYGALPPGYVLTRESEAALQAVFAANAGQPTNAQVLAAVQAVDGPEPAAPTTLPRFPDSNPMPRRG